MTKSKQILFIIIASLIFEMTNQSAKVYPYIFTATPGKDITVRTIDFDG